MAKAIDNEKGKQVKQLLVLEIQRILEDLHLREDFLMTIWGKHRDRGPLLDTIYSRWRTLRFHDLIELDVGQVALLDQFYRELEDLRFTFQYTSAMPTTLREVYRKSLTRLIKVGFSAIESLGGELITPVDFGANQERAYDTGLNRSPNIEHL
jgi:hypothetical protein